MRERRAAAQVERATRERLDNARGPDQLVAVLDARGASTLQVTRKVTLFKDTAVTLNQVTACAAHCTSGGAVRSWRSPDRGRSGARATVASRGLLKPCGCQWRMSGADAWCMCVGRRLSGAQHSCMKRHATGPDLGASSSGSCPLSIRRRSAAPATPPACMHARANALTLP